MFMTIGSFDQYRHTVDAETSVFDLRSTETDFTTGDFGHLSSCIFQLQHEGVEIGMLGTPTFHILQALFSECDEVTQSARLDRHLTRQYRTSERIVQCIRYGCHTVCRPSDRNVESENTIFITFLFKSCVYLIIGYILFGSTIQIHITLNTTQTPHILTLQIGT